MTWLIDLDGVIWLTGRPIAGGAEAVERLRRAGERVLFVTNNSAAPIAEYEHRLSDQGIPAEGDVVSSAQAAASLLEPGSSAVVCAGPGVVEALEARGVEARRDGDADAVVVGYHLDFDYERLRVAMQAVLGGARLIGTNDDPTYPTPAGPIPGGGAILAAVATASGTRPEVAGKPFPPMVALLEQRQGPGRHTVVGDRPTTDGRLAQALGARFALALSGVTQAADLPVDPAPDMVGDDLAELVAAALAEGQ
ncbi:MAG: HAD-IIA family hydrolase [Acidimicrobiales bacterium]